METHINEEAPEVVQGRDGDNLDMGGSGGTSEG